MSARDLGGTARLALFLLRNRDQIPPAGVVEHRRGDRANIDRRLGEADARRPQPFVLGAEFVWWGSWRWGNWCGGKLRNGGAAVGCQVTGNSNVELDTDKVDEAVLALLLLGLHDGTRAWKGFDWDAMDRLHEKGYVSDPRGKAKSVVFSEQGLQQAERLLNELFAKRDDR
jgi:hypothetical protein